GDLESRQATLKEWGSQIMQDHRTKEPCLKDSLRVLEEAVERTASALEGRHIYFLMQVPIRENENGISEETYELQQCEIKRVLKKDWPYCTVLGPGRWFRDGRSLVRDPGGAYYMDLDHVSSYGAKKLIRPVLEPLLERLMGGSLQTNGWRILSPGQAGTPAPPG